MNTLQHSDELKAGRQKINIMIFTLSATLVITSVKFIAWMLTHSNAILTDALESIINVVAGAFALFAAWFSAQPKDESHPYGHGKIEFLSAGFEGGLVLLAGVAMMARAVYSFFHPVEVHDVDIGLYLSGGAGLANLFLGRLLITRGKKLNSLLMQADGKHLISDTITSAGLVAGLIIIWITGEIWLDNVVAILFGALILLTGYKLVKESLAGLLDESDRDLLEQIIERLETHRVPRWIDVHNMRVLKYGSSIHIDCHVTLPWYLSLEQAHAEIDMVEALIREHYQQVELFIHADPCIPESCTICTLTDCEVRKQPMKQKMKWEMGVLMKNEKHRV